LNYENSEEDSKTVG